MTGTITVVYTKNMWSPVSWLIRYMLPRSRFALALSSHGYIQDYDDPLTYYEAIIFKGVRRVDVKEVNKNTIVRIAQYQVPNVQAGMEWLRSQVGAKYDLRGAIGVSITPDRDWREDDSWFCYELIAATLRAAGLDVFSNINHVTEVALFAIKAKFRK